MRQEKENKFRLQKVTQKQPFRHSSVNKQIFTPPPLFSLFLFTLSHPVFLSLFPHSAFSFAYTDKHTHAQTHTHAPHTYTHPVSHREPASHSLLTHTLKSYQAQLSLLRGRQEQHGSLLKELRERAAESERGTEREREGDERVKGTKAERALFPIC